MAEINTRFFALKKQIEDTLNALFEGTRFEFPVIMKKPISTRPVQKEPETAWQCPVHIDEEDCGGKKEVPEKEEIELVVVTKRFPQPKSPRDNIPAGKEDAIARGKRMPVMRLALRRH